MKGKPIIAVSGTPDGLGQADSGMYVAWLGLVAVAGLIFWATVQPPNPRRYRG